MTDRYTKLLDTFEGIPAEEWGAYFHENAGRIDTLIRLYEAYNKHVMNAQARRIHELKKSISHLTGDDHWSDIEGLEITYHVYEPALFIRGSFSSLPEDPLGTFSIHLITHTIQAWNHYEDQLLSNYTKHEPIIKGNKTILPVASIPGQQTDRILAALQDAYKRTSSLTVRNFSITLTSH